MRQRELTFEERATWGECPVYRAKDGEWCHSEVGWQLGRKVSGGQLQTGEGVHLGRLQKATVQVKLVAVY